ncbi:hypothetical protein Metal_1254 [Methylomicrobium album BG8]|uniref:Uncharacterized protein n=1 Tax=Methylomicrobium album BG8 TaxID=686340 RepID=H8GIM8_METAL|nr:hypothetical protein Metal_1254 [Methylomicrobium album BG8]
MDNDQPIDRARRLHALLHVEQHVRSFKNKGRRMR